MSLRLLQNSGFSLFTCPKCYIKSLYGSEERCHPIVAQLTPLTEAVFMILPFSSLFFLTTNLLPPSHFLLLMTLSKENGRRDYALLIAHYRQFPSSEQQYLMACLKYSLKNNWNSVSENHSVITLSMRLEEKKKI